MGLETLSPVIHGRASAFWRNALENPTSLYWQFYDDNVVATDVVAFLRFALAGLDRLDPLRQMTLVGEERFARRRGDDLPTPSRDRFAA